MTRVAQLRDLVVNERPQFLILAAISIGVLTLTAAGYYLDRLLFQRFLGKVNPVLASVAFVLLGGALLTFFLWRGWFAIYQPGHLYRLLFFSGLAILMAGIMVLVDFKIVFPEDMNAAFPHSLLFYPAVAYVAEVIFHLLPLFILLTIVTGLSTNLSFSAIIWPSIFIASLIEPVFQAMPMVGTYPTWAVAYVGFHLWVFNMIQLFLFKRYDFVSMYSFRLAYYSIWHILWGYYRTNLLF